MMDRSNLPLQGVRIVDRAVVWAGPSASWIFSLLGAEVIHLDTPYFRDTDRGRQPAPPTWPDPRVAFNPLGGGAPQIPGPAVWNEAEFNRLLWNRVCLSVNLNEPEGTEVILKLIEKSDIFLENNGAHAMEHLGLGHDVMQQRNPRLICINGPAWGRSGPYMEYVGFGAFHESLVGYTWLRGYAGPDHPANNRQRYHLDSMGAACFLLAGLMGLHYRRRTGRGLWVDLAQAQAVPHSVGEFYLDAAWNGRDHRAWGNRHATAIQGCYPCRGPEPTLETAAHGGERWINITITNDEEWEGLCKVLGYPEWAKDPKFATHESRRANHDELDQHIARWTRMRDNIEVFYMLQQNGVCAGIVMDYRDRWADAQLNSRNFFVSLPNKDVGWHRYAGPGHKFTKTPLRAYSPPPRLGEHSEYVCKDVLGMSDQEYEDLKARQVVGADTMVQFTQRPDYEGYAQANGWEIYGGPDVGHISARRIKR